MQYAIIRPVTTGAKDMFDKKFRKVVEDSIPQPVTDLTNAIDKQVKSFLNSNLKKLDVVSQSDFKNLTTSITKLSKRIDALEKIAGIKNEQTNKKTKKVTEKKTQKRATKG